MHKLIVFGSLTVLLISLTVGAAEDLANAKKRASKDADVALTSEVKDALLENGIVKPGEIQVEADDGTVQLSGFVDSELTQELALRAAAGVEGVASVRNDLVVRQEAPTRTEAKNDTVIAAQVRKHLAQQAGATTARDVNVEVEDGVVQLSGFVDSVEEKNRAADLVASVAGVKDVRNDIVLGR